MNFIIIHIFSYCSHEYWSDRGPRQMQATIGMIRWLPILCMWKLLSKPDSEEKLYTGGLFRKSYLWKLRSESGFRIETIHRRTFSEIVSIKIKIRRGFLLSIVDLIYTISEWEHPYLFCLSIFDFRPEIHIHDFRKKHRVSSRSYPIWFDYDNTGYVFCL